MNDDYVKRSDVHKVFQPKYAPAINRTFAAMIDSVPAADVVEVGRAKEVAHAEEQGRLVILPCKVGDMVYYRRGRDILGDTVERIIIDGLDNQVLVGAHKAYMFCDFGKTVFLTREEAKTALERIQDEK